MQWNQCSPATFTLLTLDHLHLANTEARADCDCLPRDRNCIAVRTPFGGWFKVISPEVVIYQLRAGLHNASIYKGHLGLHASLPHNIISTCSSLQCTKRYIIISLNITHQRLFMHTGGTGAIAHRDICWEVHVLPNDTISDRHVVECGVHT